MAFTTNLLASLRRSPSLRIESSAESSRRPRGAPDLFEPAETFAFAAGQERVRGVTGCTDLKTPPPAPLRGHESLASRALRSIHAEGTKAGRVATSLLPIVFRGNDGGEVTFQCGALLRSDVTLLRQLVVGPWADSAVTSGRTTIDLQLLSSSQLQSIARFVAGQAVVPHAASTALGDLRSRCIEAMKTAEVCGSSEMQEKVREQWRSAAIVGLLDAKKNGRDAMLIRLLARSLYGVDARAAHQLQPTYGAGQVKLSLRNMTDLVAASLEWEHDLT